jgi:hypothetical protein
LDVFGPFAHDFTHVALSRPDKLFSKVTLKMNSFFRSPAFPASASISALEHQHTKAFQHCLGFKDNCNYASHPRGSLYGLVPNWQCPITICVRLFSLQLVMPIFKLDHDLSFDLEKISLTPYIDMVL